MKQIKTIGLMIYLLLLSACGYHLRGNLDLPEGLNNIYLQGASGPLRNILKKDLKFTTAKLVEGVKNADIVIKVIKENLKRNTLSLSDSGRANEYELYYILDYQLFNAEGEALTQIQPIEIIRDYFNDQEELLGKNNEEQVIRDEIYRQAVKTMLNQSRVVLNKRHVNTDLK